MADITNIQEYEYDAILRQAVAELPWGHTDVNSCDSDYNRSILHEAVVGRADSIACDLIDRGIDLNLQDKNGQTALHFCAQYNCYEIAKTMLAKGEEINLVDKWGNNPLWTAVFNARGEYRMVKLFVDYNADIHNKNKAKRSPLDFATQIGDDDMVKILLRKEVGNENKETTRCKTQDEHLAAQY